ncbi:7750_t:CDS:2 [Acaulospora morrowiae]|uniref:7750_t:CDS:1 n=1 Tax=Acaulospora morrowiae TaxID=94023 RepID=A0A9N8WUH2_9GLOM|nr:7750_t:CDS:2 [Acaulospora morrowiae]
MIEEQVPGATDVKRIPCRKFKFDVPLGKRFSQAALTYVACIPVRSSTSVDVGHKTANDAGIDVELNLDNFTSPPATHIYDEHQNTQISASPPTTIIHTEHEISKSSTSSPTTNIHAEHENSTFKGSSRPSDGYLLNISSVNEYCEPNDYQKEAFKKYRIQSCLDFLSMNKSSYLFKPENSTLTYNEKPMQFHVYWKGKLNDKISLMIRSFLYTQPLDSSVLNVWMDSNDEDLTNNSHIRPLLKFSPKNIQFRIWNCTEQLSHDPIYKGWKRIMRKQLKKIQTVGYSDMVRFVLLQRYGGLYVDADVLLLRDMRPLYYLDYEWSYRWSEWFHYNTAVLRLWKNSTIGRTIISAAMKHKMNFHPMRIKKYLVRKKNITRSDVNKKLYMMPVTMFDPLWLKSDLSLKKQIMVPNLSQFKDVFSRKLLRNEFPGVNKKVTKNTNAENIKRWRKKEKFFDGAFTYHWHNNWNRRINSMSWMGILKRGYDDFLEGKGANLYNEYIVT